MTWRREIVQYEYLQPSAVCQMTPNAKATIYYTILYTHTFISSLEEVLFALTDGERSRHDCHYCIIRLYTRLNELLP